MLIGSAFISRVRTCYPEATPEMNAELRLQKCSSKWSISRKMFLFSD